MTNLTASTLRLAAKALQAEHDRNDKALENLYATGSPARPSIARREGQARELNLALTEINELLDAHNASVIASLKETL